MEETSLLNQVIKTEKVNITSDGKTAMQTSRDMKNQGNMIPPKGDNVDKL